MLYDTLNTPRIAYSISKKPVSCHTKMEFAIQFEAKRIEPKKKKKKKKKNGVWMQLARHVFFFFFFFFLGGGEGGGVINCQLRLGKPSLR